MLRTHAIVRLLLLEASVKLPGLIAIVAAAIQTLALIKVGANGGFFTASGNAQLNQTIDVNTVSVQESVLVNDTLGKALYKNETLQFNNIFQAQNPNKKLFYLQIIGCLD